MSLDTLLAASEAGKISLRYYDELHPAPPPLSGRSYGAFAASLDDASRHLPQLFAAFGIAEPDADVALTVDDEAMIGAVLGAVVATGQIDLAVRAIRMYGEGARRAADAALGIYAEAVGAPRRRTRGAARGRAVRPPAPAVGAVRRAQRRDVRVAGGPSPEPGDRRVQHRRERADHVRVRLHHGAPRGPAGGRVRRPDRLHATDRGAGRRGGRGRGAAARRPDHRLGRRTWRARGQAARRRRAHQVRPLRRRRRRDAGGPGRTARAGLPIGPRGRDERAAHHARRRRVRQDRQHGRADRRRGAGRAAVGPLAAAGPLPPGRFELRPVDPVALQGIGEVPLVDVRPQAP